MDTPAALFHWLDTSALLVQRICVVVSIAFVSFRAEWLQGALQGAGGRWKDTCVVIAVFGLFAMLGSHGGIVVDVHGGAQAARWPGSLREEQAIINFRDVLVACAGLLGGLRTGIGVGFVAGLERYFLGGFSGLACGLASLLTGLAAGLCHRRYCAAPHPWTASAFGVAALALQKGVILWLVSPFEAALQLVRLTIVPTLVVNVFGCYLFMAVTQTLDRDRLRLFAKQAELRALRAQVEPHFLMNTLNAIKTLVRLDPERARLALVRLGQFFHATHASAQRDTVDLRQELGQLRDYVDLHRLRYAERLRYRERVEESAWPCLIQPHCLLPIVENALTHGFPEAPKVLEIELKAVCVDERLTIEITDNGQGIASERLASLGRGIVASAQGSGSGLYNVRRSLILAHGEAASLHIDSGPGGGVRVTLTLPAKRLE
ncbi:MAG: LytS/YhcK type 5TM receptor domain-containing protein [Gammaproteobacteria bacterium]